MLYIYNKVGLNIDGYECVTDIVTLSGVTGSEIVVYIDKGITNIEDIKDIGLLARDNSVYLILDSLDVEVDTLKMLVISNLVVRDNYNIYILGGEELNKEYVDNIRCNKVTRVDFRMYINKSLDSLVHLGDTLGDGDDIDSDVSALGKVHIRNMLGLYRLDLLGSYKQQIEQLQAKVTNLESTRVFSGDIGSNVKLKEYTTLNLGSYTNGLKGVLYFKEYTPVMYMNSLIHYYITLLTSDKYKHKVKLIVCDDLNDLNSLYDNFVVVKGENINRDIGKYLSAERLLITDRSTALLDHILKDLSLHGYVIVIYDRMHSIKDMVYGGRVVKYSLFSGRGSYDKIKARYNSVELGENIISNKSIVNNGIVLQGIDNYINKTTSVKSALYIKYTHSYDNKPLLVYERFNKDLGLSNITRR